jgi:hypothetical protein
VIATPHVVYDWIFVIHVMTAVAALVVLIALRAGAAVAITRPDAVQSRFPDRPDWAIRVVHLLPLTGVALVLTGGTNVSVAHAWVQVGLGCYLIAGTWIEVRVRPDERSLARALRGTEDVRAEAIALVRTLDTALVIITIAMITMIVQF